MSDAPTLRETIENAMNAEAEAIPEVAPEPVAEVEAPVEAAPEAPAKPRDEAGRFAKAEKARTDKAVEAAKDAAQPAEPAPAPEVKPPEPVAEARPALRAPSSWKPAAREAFAKAPPEVQEEIVRVDREVRAVMQQAAPARQLAERVQQTLAPYEGIARANGMDSMQFAGTVLQQAAVLQMGTPQQKAALVSQIINAYGIDVEAVNAAMQGQPVQPQPAPQQDVGRLVEQAFQQRMAQAQEQRAAQAWQEFQGTQPEFLDAVKGDMQEILELAGRQGRNMTYQQAYDRACKLNEEVASVLASRKAAEAVRAQAPAVQRAKAAASSIKATPATAVTRAQGPRSLRETIEDAVAAQRT